MESKGWKEKMAMLRYLWTCGEIRYLQGSLTGRSVAKVSSSASVSSGARAVDAHSQNSCKSCNFCTCRHFENVVSWCAPLTSGSERAAVVVRVAEESGGADTVHAGTCKRAGVESRQMERLLTGRVSGCASAAVVVGGAEVSLSAETSDASSDCRTTGASGYKEESISD